MKAKLVKESLLEFHQTGDPLSSLRLGFYEAWRNMYDKTPIINIIAHLSHETTGEKLTYFAGCFYSKDFEGDPKDCLYFEDITVALGWQKNNSIIYNGPYMDPRILNLRPSHFFGGPEEAVIYDNASILFNKEIIDVLRKEKNKGALKILDEYAKEWYEEESSFLSVIETWLNNSEYIVKKITASYNEIS